MIRMPAILLAALATATLTSTAHAQKSKHPHPAATAQQPNHAASTAAPGGFSAAERDAITSYFKNHPMHAKPLPPGIAKNLRRGKPLPPGIAKRQLPAPLLERLPHVGGAEAQAQVTIFGDRIVLLDAKGVVVDILAGVLGT